MARLAPPRPYTECWSSDVPETLARCGTTIAALEALHEIAHRGGRGRRIDLPPVSRIEDEIAATEKLGARLVACCEAEFPKLLHALDPPPPMLTMLGNPEHARPEAVAIVGARNASAAGRKIARDVAAELGRIGLAVIAGLGIDGEGHAASLASGTVAVLGGSIDQVYPPQHERLHREIAERGLIISESPTGYTARGQDFPHRNRIVTSLARGTVVVEAAERSGSLISARITGEQGREVMAVPGSPWACAQPAPTGWSVRAPRWCAMRRMCSKCSPARLRYRLPRRRRLSSRRTSPAAKRPATCSPACARRLRQMPCPWTISPAPAASAPPSAARC